MSQTGNSTQNNFNNLRRKIKSDLIDPTYYSDVKSNLKARKRWKRLGDFTLTISQICIGICSVISFSAGFFGYNYLSFIAGCFSVLSLIFQHFSTFSMKESENCNKIINEILDKIGLYEIIDIATDQNDLVENSNNSIAMKSLKKIKRVFNKTINNNNNNNNNHNSNDNGNDNDNDHESV